MTDKLRSYGFTLRELMPETIDSTKQYENNRAEQSHEANRVRERWMRRLYCEALCDSDIHRHVSHTNFSDVINDAGIASWVLSRTARALDSLDRSAIVTSCRS